MKARCAGRPPDWWDIGDDGNRLALLLCRNCPVLERCADGDKRPHGVIRAGVAWSDTGFSLPICECGYPQTTYRGGMPTLCLWCRVPQVRIMSRREYWRQRDLKRRERGELRRG